MERFWKADNNLEVADSDDIETKGNLSVFLVTCEGGNGGRRRSGSQVAQMPLNRTDISYSISVEMMTR